MQAGLHLTNALGETLEVVSQTALEQTATVYNIQVHEHSTHHVGEMGVWVHNENSSDVDSCKELKSTKKVGDNLEHDHISSVAALFRNMKNQLGRPLTVTEKNELYNKATAIEVPKQVHKQSPTFGGKNNKAQIQNDALDLEAAILRDTEATKNNLINWGLDPDLVNARIKQVIEKNKKLGIIK